MSQPVLIGQALATHLIQQHGALPPGTEVYPPLKQPVFTECVWLRRLGDFAHIHPLSEPCPQKDQRRVAPPWRKPWRL